MKNIYQQVLLDRQRIPELVLATVTSTSGSTPQKAGSSALFDSSGLVSGTVGGGILEGRTQELAIEAVNSRKPGSYLFMLDNSVSNGEDALCGGKINILIDPELNRHIDVFENIMSSIEAGTPGILVTEVKVIKEGDIQISRYWITEGKGIMIPGEIASAIEPEIMNMLAALKPGDFREKEIMLPGKEAALTLYLEPIIPPLRLIIAGAGHIGKVLAKIGQMLDFHVTVVDDRPEFANSENIQHADKIINEDIAETIARIKKDEDTFIVIVTRGHKDDAAALRACIGSAARYIGMIGSRNKVALMRSDFIVNRWATEEEWNRICAPVGLDIGSRTVEEIAVSIAAQLVKIKNA